MLGSKNNTFVESTLAKTETLLTEALEAVRLLKGIEE
jgi:hypothetical protein